MRIFLFDKNYTDGVPSAWSVALDDRFKSIVTKSGCGTPPEYHFAYKDPQAIMFVHTDRQIDWEVKAKEEGTLCHFVFVRSDLRVPTLTNDQGNIHGCYWTATEFGSTQHREINLFVDRIINEVSSDPVDWTLLESPKFEESLALRLLAEAWRHGNGTALIDTELRINPPVGDEWFSPFDRYAEAEAASSIATEIGTGSAEAEALLKSVLEGGATDILCLSFLNASAKHDDILQH
jgi:hypothetical protein